MFATSELHTGVLSDISDIVMGQSPKSDTYNNDAIGLPLLNGAADFKNGKIEAHKYTSDPKKVVRPGDYIFGVRATIGQTTKVFQEYATGRGTGSARPKEVYLDEYLFFALQDTFTWFSQTGSGSVYINISKSDFHSFELQIPDTNALLKFHESMKPLLDKTYQNNAEIADLEALRNALLPKLLSGEIQLN
ncbi:restriction endonuclease subunit S [Periweissella cryptocerci]|uniref:Restriction endonuclease subunit S n=1 Tax=Periweissella cryptocerci TaxID=2506420 RepID=A0A4P6YSS1_9LACO|nr:restriction endonuclease subunit S [Periweissella cryptocerci]QBO35779.1 restriction endonuclease subunit S [Periweissella cryptocerci]